MKSKIFQLPLAIAAFSLSAVSLISCDDKDGINGYMPTRPIGGYSSSKEIATASRVAHFSFDGHANDSISGLTGTATGVTFVPGRKGQAYKGSATGQVVYPTPSNAITNLQSFTVSMWINTQKHASGAEAVFTLPRTSDFWGNMFMLIESNTGPTDSMFIKFNFAGQWAELNGANRPANMYNGWKHIAFSYNATTSKFNAYINGTKMNLPASMTDRKNGTNPLGPISFTDPSRLIIGGYQQHIGAPWGAADPGWMMHYTGMLDEFRIYNIALADADINALYKLEQLGR